MEIKSRGILFKPEMLEAAENGTKTQTRRICKNNQNKNNFVYIIQQFLNFDFLAFGSDGEKILHNFGKCPYGLPGDYLYVKEAWKLIGCNFDDGKFIIQYKNGDKKTFDATAEDISHWLLTKFDKLENRGILKKINDKSGFDFTNKNYPFESPLFMPKFIARKFFKIKNVRIEKLHSISEEDAFSEGVIKDVKLPLADFKTKTIYRDYRKETFGCYDAKSSFMTLWQKINGKESWNKNPYVWIIEFEKVGVYNLM